MDKENCDKIAQIVRTHGIDGGIILKFDDDFPDSFIEEEFVFVEIDDILIPFFVESYKVRNTETAIVKLEDVDTDAQAKEMVHLSVYVEQVDVVTPDDEDLTLTRLVGLTATNADGSKIGKITGILNIPNNDQFEITRGKEELLVPINDDWIIDIDFDTKKIELHLPEGLLDL